MPEYKTARQRLISQEAVSDIGYIRASVDRFWYKNRFIPKELNNIDIENPNNIRGRLYIYSLINNGTDSNIRKYMITAEHKKDRTGREIDKIAWIQENNNIGHFYIYRSASLP